MARPAQSSNARVPLASAVCQCPRKTLPDAGPDRLGYDGAGRPIAKRYLTGGIGDGVYADTTAVVGFTTEYDLASNKFYERELHAESRSHLYEPFAGGVPQGGYDSLDRLRQYKRGVPMSPFAPAKVARSSREARGQQQK